MATGLKQNEYGKYLLKMLDDKVSNGFCRNRTTRCGLIEPAVHGDERGYFMETWQARHSGKPVSTPTLCRTTSASRRRAHCEGCITSSSRRRGSSCASCPVRSSTWRSTSGILGTFGQWVGHVLSEENKHQLWIPPGFGHGFLVLSETAQFEYKCTDYYAPKHERCIRWDDPDIGINWPLSAGEKPVLSAKDAAAPFLEGAETYA